MSEASKGKDQSSEMSIGNNVQAMREKLLLSKSELARKAGVSALTIDRVEKGSRCRMDTKRKILLALGLKLSDRREVFFEDEQEPVKEASREQEVTASLARAQRRSQRKG